MGSDFCQTSLKSLSASFHKRRICILIVGLVLTTESLELTTGFGVELLETHIRADVIVNTRKVGSSNWNRWSRSSRYENKMRNEIRNGRKLSSDHKIWSVQIFIKLIISCFKLLSSILVFKSGIRISGRRKFDTSKMIQQKKGKMKEKLADEKPVNIRRCTALKMVSLISFLLMKVMLRFSSFC